MKRNEADVCLECEEIFIGLEPRCPVCGSARATPVDAFIPPLKPARRPGEQFGPPETVGRPLGTVAE